MSKINTPFCKLIHKMAYDRSFCDDSFIMSEKTLHFKSKSILPSHFLPDSWACPHPVLASCFLTDIQNISFLNGCGCRYGEDDFFYAVLFHRRHNVKPVSHNRNSLNVTPFLLPLSSITQQTLLFSSSAVKISRIMVLPALPAPMIIVLTLLSR